MVCCTMHWLLSIWKSPKKLSIVAYTFCNLKRIGTAGSQRLTEKLLIWQLKKKKDNRHSNLKLSIMNWFSRTSQLLWPSELLSFILISICKKSNHKGLRNLNVLYSVL